MMCRTLAAIGKKKLVLHETGGGKVKEVIFCVISLLNCCGKDAGIL